MNIQEKILLDILKDLKENFNATSVKAEFETEGASFQEALSLKELTTRAGLNLTIKIGGCGSVKDLNEAKTIGANTIVAPMIESSYAAKKYIQSMELAFSKEEINKIKFFINIETITGFKCLEEILNSDFSKNINGIVFGRTDMAGSLGLDKNAVNENEISNYAKEIGTQAKKYNKEFIIGGGISTQSLPFLRNLNSETISSFETRKIVFDAKKALNNPNIEEGIKKAIEFELVWLKNKRENNSFADNKRIETLESIVSL